MTALQILAMVLFLPTIAGSVTLTNVPMQGTMVMPLIAYHTAGPGLSVQVNPTVPQLTPLLVSNPGDFFDPADPWFDCLDPTRQGLAFSRRYGFSMDTSSDAVPNVYTIWIRKLSSSSGLSAYRYRSGTTRLWEPIFGTAGVSNALAWDTVMFHPAFTAAPVNGACTATFEAFLVDNSTGLAVPGATTGPFALNWTVVADGRPALNIALSEAGQILVQWPAATANYVLQAAETLTGSDWTTVTNVPLLLEGQMTVVLETGPAAKFFRMRLNL